MYLIGAYAVLAVGDEPDGGEPLVQAKRTVLEYRAGLGREPLLGVLCPAFPYAAGADEPRGVQPARRACDAIGPAKLDHGSQGDFGIGEVPDGFDEGFGFLLHELTIPQNGSASSIITPLSYDLMLGRPCIVMTIHAAPVAVTAPIFRPSKEASETQPYW